MAIEYKIDLLKALKKAGYSSTRLRKEKILSESTMQQLRRGELVSWRCIDRICEILMYQPGQILKRTDERIERLQKPQE